MALRTRPGAALLGLTVGAAVVLSACGQVPRQAAPRAESVTSTAPTTAPTAPSTSPPSTAPTGGASQTPRTGSTGGTSQKQPGPSADAPAKPSTAPKKAPARAAALMKPGSTGDQVRELQHRLRQLTWLEGKITASYGTTTTKAVAGFQDKRGLPPSGEVDRSTWSLLTKMTRKPTRDEMYDKVVAGPAIMKAGAKGDQVRGLQARLKQLGWFAGDVTGGYGAITTTAVRGFQGKRGLPATGAVDRLTWDRLVGMTETPTKDQLLNRSPQSTGTTKGLDSRCLTGRVMCISKRNNKITWVVDGRAKLAMDVRFGADETPTRNGSFRVFRKTVNGVSTLYHTRMPWAMTFSGGQAVHYSPDFAARGYNGASHGCVNVRDHDGVKWLWHQVRLGDKVVVYS